jgi:kumamolisin
MYQRRYTHAPDAVAKPYRFVELPLHVDAAPLAAEIRAAKIGWLRSQWKWHLGTSFAILRGGPDRGFPGSRLAFNEGRGGVDAPDLAQLPQVKALLDTAFPAPAALAWLGLSPPGARIFLHVDDTAHWDRHHRLHVPLVTSEAARLCVAGGFLHMPAGSVWLFNNSVPHGGENLGPARVHLMVDLPATPEVEAFLAQGTPREGAPDPEALARIARDPLEALTAADRRDASLMARLTRQ